MRPPRSIENAIKKHLPRGVQLYRGLRLRRDYTPAYFERALADCVALVEGMTKTPFADYQTASFRAQQGIGLENSVIEINNTCNIDCLMCKTSLSTRPKGMMSEEMLELSVRRTKELGIGTVDLHTIGDPLAN